MYVPLDGRGSFPATPPGAYSTGSHPLGFKKRDKVKRLAHKVAVKSCVHRAHVLLKVTRQTENELFVRYCGRKLGVSLL